MDSYSEMPVLEFLAFVRIAFSVVCGSALLTLGPPRGLPAPSAGADAS